MNLHIFECCAWANTLPVVCCPTPIDRESAAPVTLLQ
jgi:hypothetical protein